MIGDCQCRDCGFHVNTSNDTKIPTTFSTEFHARKAVRLIWNAVVKDFLNLSEYEKQFVRTKEILVGLNAIIEHYKPAYTVGKVIVLKSFMVLGQQVYLGINSSTLKDSMLRLDGNTMLPFNTSLFKVGGTLDEK